MILLTKSQLKGLADIASDSGQVFLASMVVPFFVGTSDIKFLVLLLGLIFTLISWIFSLSLRRRLK